MFILQTVYRHQMESNMVIRESVAEDSQAIAELSCQLGYPAIASEITERLIRITEHPDNCVLTAEIDGQVIGWIHAFHTLRVESQPFVEIAGLVVDEEWRGRDVGKALVHSVIEWAARFPVLNLRVRSNLKRHEAHEFYRHMGFVEIKDQKIFNLSLPDSQ